MTETSLQDAYAHCKTITIEADSNFALGFSFLPEEKRNAIYAVYAFNRLADDFADELTDGQDPAACLDKWKYYLDECYRGNTSGHPVMIAFTDAVNRYSIPKKPFTDAIEGFRMDLRINRYRTFGELSVYCDRVAGTISTMSLHIFGWDNERVFEYGRNLSYALQLTNIIRDVGNDIGKNRIYLPLEDLERFSYSEHELLSRADNERFHSLMQFEIDRALTYFRDADPLIQLIHEDARFTVVMIGAVYARLLRKIIRKNIPVLASTVALTRWEKLLLTARMRRNPTFIL